MVCGHLAGIGFAAALCSIFCGYSASFRILRTKYWKLGVVIIAFAFASRATTSGDIFSGHTTNICAQPIAMLHAIQPTGTCQYFVGCG